MILAVYTKNKTKDKWLLYSLAESMERAKKQARFYVNRAKKIGYDEATSVIQGFETAASIPKNLGEEIKPEKLLWS